MEERWEMQTISSVSPTANWSVPVSVNIPLIHSLRSVLPNPCNQGEPLLDLSKEPVICGGEDTCASGYWCHVGATPETTNCCPGSEKIQRQEENQPI